MTMVEAAKQIKCWRCGRTLFKANAQGIVLITCHRCRAKNTVDLGVVRG